MHRITGTLRWPLLALSAFAALAIGVPAVARAEVTPVTIATASLPDAQAGVAYTQTLNANGGATPYHWAITTGALPAGLGLDAASGVISGTPTTAGDATFTAQVMDADDSTAAQTLAIHVVAAAEHTSAVAAICASDLSGQPELAALCTLWANDRLPEWAQPIIARMILRIAAVEVHREAVTGRVAAVSGATINVNTREGVVAVVTDAGTTFSLDGVAATLADVQVGYKIAAKGTHNADGSLQAQSVRLESADHESGRVRASGTVTAITGATLTIEHRGKHSDDDGDEAGDEDRPAATQIVITTDETVFTHGGDTIALADIELGARIKATGTLDVDGALVASAVKVDGKAKPNASIRAKLAGVNGLARSCDAKPGQRGEQGRAQGLKQRCGQDRQD